MKGHQLSIPLFLLDSLIVNLSFVLASLIYFDVQPEISWELYIIILGCITVLNGIILWLFDLYTDWRRRGIYDLVVSILLAILTLALVLLVYTWLDLRFSFAYFLIVLAAGIQIACLVLGRCLVWYMSRKLFGSKRVLIIAQDPEEEERLTNKLRQHIPGWFTVGDCLSVRRLAWLESYLESVDVVLVNAEIPQKAEIIRVCTKLGIEVLLVPANLELFLWRSELQQVDDLLVLSIKRQDLNLRQRLVKRTFDIVVAALMILILAPVMLALYLAIPLSSAGPALFRQERVGKNHRTYAIYKFRSMIQDAEKLCGPALAAENDPRITPLGRLIRLTRLDELPQLFNVLKGEMSLVGPRPERPCFVEKFEQSIEQYSYRLAMKPGITGLAQVLGLYSTTAEDKLRFDLLYMHNYSFALDLKILLQTVLVVLKREQAGGVPTQVKVLEQLR